MIERKGEVPDLDFGDLVDHGDWCDGLPIFTTDSVGQWTAQCVRGDFEVTGCETRREAGARFYGGEQPDLFGQTDTAALADLVQRLVSQARALRNEINDMRAHQGAGLTRLENILLDKKVNQFNILNRFVNPDTGDVR